MNRSVFLDSDASSGDWVFLVITDRYSATTYRHQCGGHSNQMRSATGVGVPCLGSEQSVRLQRFFASIDIPELDVGKQMKEEQLDDLRTLVAAVEVVATLNGEEVSSRLEIDTSRRHEILEGWIPVRVADLEAVLMFPNSD